MVSTPKVIRSSAPAKVILFGEHAVVYGKTAMAAAINYRTSVELTLNKKNVLKFSFAKLQLDVLFPMHEPTVPADFEPQKKRTLECALAIYNRVKPLKNGVDVTVDSDFPLRSGLGSSASLSVALTSVFVAYKFIETGLSIFDASEKFTPEFQNQVLEISNLCERIFHGSPSGVDTATSFLGGIVQFQRDTMPFKLADTMPMKIAIVDSKVERNTAEMVARVADRHARSPREMEFIFREINKMTLAAAKLITATDFNDVALLELVTLNQGMLCGLEVNHPAFNVIKEAVSGFQVALKVTGAGGGGNGIIFIPNSVSAEDVCNAVKGAGFEPKLVTVGVPGLEVTVI